MQPIQNGMSLRDYFAAAALTGAMANPNTVSTQISIALAAYLCADAMLAERDK
jgi:hypothetical protein